MDTIAPKRRRLSEVPTINYPEDRLIQSFHDRNPDVSRLPATSAAAPLSAF